MSFTTGVTLTSYSRGQTPITQIVLHESVTTSRAKTIAVLKGRALGVHIIVDRDGTITQHAPFERACAHAEGFGKPSLHNETSIGVEVVNAYYGSRALKSDTVIDAVWADKRRYIVPTEVQLEAVWQTVHTLCAMHGIPTIFPGATDAGFRWGTITKHEVPGIMAHQRWAHADALFVEHYCLARHLGCEPVEAFALTLQRAQSVTAGKRTTPLPMPVIANSESAK